MIEMYTSGVFRDNLSFKIILAPLLSRNDAKSKMKHLVFLQKFAVLDFSLEPQD